MSQNRELLILYTVLTCEINVFDLHVKYCQVIGPMLTLPTIHPRQTDHHQTAPGTLGTVPNNSLGYATFQNVFCERFLMNPRNAGHDNEGQTGLS